MKAYTSYKKSDFDWIDKIPSHWHYTKIKYLSKGDKTSFIDGDWIESPYITDAGFRLIQTGNIGIGVYKEQGFRYISERTFIELKCKEVNPNDILICRLASPVGRACLAPNLGIRMITSVDVCILKPSNSFDPRFIVYQMSSKHYLDYVEFISRGSTRARISRSILGDLVFVAPPLIEQQAIANFLDHKTAQIDALIDQKQRQIEHLQEYRSALINQAVTKGLDPNVPMKDSGIEWLGEIPEHWEISRLKFIGKTLIGLTYKPEEIVNDKYGSLVLRAGNIKNGKIALNDNIYVDKRIPEEIITQKGDILICSRSGSRALIGKNAIIDEIVAGSTFGVFMTLFRSPMNDYLYYIFNSRLFEFQSGLFMTSTINQLTLSVLKNFSVPIPPKYKQKDIVDFLDKKTYNIDKLIDKLNSLIVYYQEYRTALISEAVTGKIDVRDWKGIENGIQTDCP